MIFREEILELIPHAGGMCLLDSVDCWDDAEIRCSTHSHRDPANPLRSEGAISAIHGLEYGAQAMAVHGGLLARKLGERKPGGYMALVRDLHLAVQRLDLYESPLRVHARRLLADGGNGIYRIEIQAAGAKLLDARVSVMEVPL